MNLQTKIENEVKAVKSHIGAEAAKIFSDPQMEPRFEEFDRAFSALVPLAFDTVKDIDKLGSFNTIEDLLKELAAKYHITIPAVVTEAERYLTLVQAGTVALTQKIDAVQLKPILNGKPVAAGAGLPTSLLEAAVKYAFALAKNLGALAHPAP